MKSGTFTYILDGVTRVLPVRECPNPAPVRAWLEARMGVPVAWRERIGPRP